jgi:hypothetical protein
VVTLLDRRATAQQSAPTCYAVVLAPGCYASSSRVWALSVHSDRAAALRKAQNATLAYRAAPGGSAGGYRVVTTTARTAREANWLGHELDRKLDVQS